MRSSDLAPQLPLGLHAKRLSDLGQGGSLRLAHPDGADAEKPTLLSGLGGPLRRPKEPPLGALGLARRFPTEAPRPPGTHRVLASSLARGPADAPSASPVGHRP
jgi:hypothetical protein